MVLLGNVDLEVVIILALVAALAYTGSALMVHRMRGSRSRGGDSPARPNVRTGTTRLYNRIDAADQLRAVMAARFERRRVMGMAEYKLFSSIEEEVRACRPGFRVFAQTALGEVIKSVDRDAHSAINSKRADILVIDLAGYPVLAAEYQGRSRFQKDAAARDAIKREALRKAGVHYLEFFEQSTEDDIRRTVRDALERGVPPAPLPTTPPAAIHPFVEGVKLGTESPESGERG